MVVVVDPGSASRERRGYRIHDTRPPHPTGWTVDMVIYTFITYRKEGMIFEFLSWLGILTGKLLESLEEVGACNFACESK